MTKSEIYKKINQHYEKMRMLVFYEQQEKQKLIYQKIPRIQEIDQEISSVGVKIAKAVLKKPDDSEKLAYSLKKILKQLKEEKKELLKQAGLKEDFMDLKYHCEKCKDTGYIDTKRCICFQQKLINIIYNQSNLGEIIKAENFQTFNINLYRDQRLENEKISPKENMFDIYGVCKKFIKDFENTFENLLFYGNTGLGKTFLCNCIAKELMDRGKTVLYMTAGQLFKAVEDSHFKREEQFEYTNILDDVLTVDLLIIDDLGTEFSTILSSSELFHIINERLLTKKPVVLSTNLAPSDLINHYSDRIVSRLTGGYKVLKFFGDDIRFKKKFTI